MLFNIVPRLRRKLGTTRRSLQQQQVLADSLHEKL